MTTDTAIRPETVEATVAEFVGWVQLLRDAADSVASETVKVAPILTFEQACTVLDQCRDSVQLVHRAESDLAARISEVWEEGKAAVLDVDGVLVDVPVDLHHTKDRRHWDHDGLMRLVVQRHLEQAAAEGRVPDPFEVGTWVLEAALPSYWRLQILADLGIDPEPFCARRDLIPAIELRKPAQAKADDTTQETHA